MLMGPYNAEKRSKLSAVVSGALGRCPRCGQGRLLDHYIKIVSRCSVCGESYGHYRADDSAPWMTILVVGHIIVPILLVVERSFQRAMWVELVVWPLLTLMLALTLLPRCKGIVLALLWITKGEGSERL